MCKIGIPEFREGVTGRRPGGPTGIVLDTDDIQEFRKRLSSKGVHFSNPPAKQVWEGWQADLGDFDGNTMQMVDPQHYVRKIPRIEQASR
jgi:predicted enzyme related to lactoylglutathione lyase